MGEQISVQFHSEHFELLTKLRGTANTGRGVMKLYESGEAFAADMGVPVSKMEESIEARIQTSMKIAQRILAAILGTKLLARWVQGRGFITTPFRKPTSQHSPLHSR